MIERYKDLIKLVDARGGVPPAMEPLILKAYLDIFGADDNFKGYVKCKCVSYFKLMYSQLKIKLNDYERGLQKND